MSAGIVYLTGNMSKAVAAVTSTLLTTFPINPTQMELESYFEAGKEGNIDWAHGVKITFMNHRDKDGIIQFDILYEPWIDDVMYGEEGLVGTFYPDDWDRLWR